MTAPTVFISYSQDSDEHNARILELANRLRADGIDVTIDQYESSPAEGWPKWMDRHIAKDDFVLAVCTETYYHRVMDDEEMGKGRGIKWESTLTYQHIYDNDSHNTRFIPILFVDSKTDYVPAPLKGATYYFLFDGYDKLYRRLTNQPETVKPELGKLRSLPPREPKSDYLGVRVSLASLPSTSPDLFGRENELKELDEAWKNPHINAVTLVAWGGVGKSALVNKWLTQMARDNYREAERVYGWSFYSQGAAEGRQVSADQFIASALAWFGDPEMANSPASAWDKGERLAELVIQSPTLLILDGLEPLQNPPPVETGRIKDPALVAFLRELARQNRGLVLITTRLAVDDLKDFIGSTAIERDLDSLSDEAGAAYLKHLGVDGIEEERKVASHDFGGHALALTLLGSYLKVVHHGDIRKRKEIPHVMDEQKQGKHARRVMKSYEVFLNGKPELDILRLMGLFDRPAEKGALNSLREEPAIDGLTNAIQKLKDVDWQYAINNLRDLRLIARPSTTLVAESAPRSAQDEELDCHPLLREHFGEQLKEGSPGAWREGNNRLYEYYKASAKELPDTIQEMAPLYAAVMHGCQAGKHQEALSKVYWMRTHRSDEGFSVKKLGALGADLASLSGFFDGTSWRKPIDGLSDSDKGFVLNQVGFDLRSLGRLTEAAQPMQAGLTSRTVIKDWKNAAISAGNLSELYLTIGDVTQALAYAEKSVQFADQSGNAFMRMANRTKIANAQHQAGILAEAETAFREAEEIQAKQDFWSSPTLVSIWGFSYCALLLSKEQWQDVQERANQSLIVGEKIGGDLLSSALDNLSLGYAHLLQSQQESYHPFTESRTYLNRAVDGLREAGDQTYLPPGLLARVQFWRVTGALDKAQKDLDEAFSIATRGGMGLFLADCHLEYGRLKIQRGKRADGQRFYDEAREHLKTAKEMIEKMGYHRRDKEVEELEKELGMNA